MTDDTTERDLSELSGDSESRILKVVLERWLEIDAGLSSQLVERWPQLRRGNGRLEAINELLKNAFEGEEATKKAAALRWRVLEAMDAYHVEGEGTDPVSFLERREKEKAMPVRRRERGEVGRLPSWGKAPSTRWVTAGILLLMTVMMVVFGPALFEDRSFLAETYVDESDYRVEVEGASLVADERVSEAVQSLRVEVESELTDVEQKLRDVLEGKGAWQPDSEVASMLEIEELKQSREQFEASWKTLRQLDESGGRIMGWLRPVPLVVRVAVTDPVTRGGTIFGGGRFECQAVFEVVVPPSDSSWHPWVPFEADLFEQIVARAGLSDHWSMTAEQALTEVMTRVQVRNFFGKSHLIGIKAAGETGVEATDLLGYVSEAFRSLYEERERLRTKLALQAIRKELRSQEDLVSEHWNLMQTILRAVAPDEVVDLEKRKYRCRINLRKLRALKGEELQSFVDELKRRSSQDELPSE